MIVSAPVVQAFVILFGLATLLLEWGFPFVRSADFFPHCRMPQSLTQQLYQVTRTGAGRSIVLRIVFYVLFAALEVLLYQVRSIFLAPKIPSHVVLPSARRESTVPSITSSPPAFTRALYSMARRLAVRSHRMTCPWRATLDKSKPSSEPYFRSLLSSLS